MTPTQKENPENQIKELNEELVRTQKNLITLKDVRDLALVKAEPEVFSEKLPVYFRSDLLRIAASLDWVKKCNEKCFFVYTDFNVAPISKAEIFDDTTQTKLEKFGTVFQQKHEDITIENSFHIIGNNNQNLIKALQLAIVDVNVNRAKVAIADEYLVRAI